MGFTANYAIFVHENMDAVFKRPGSGPKFLEKALERNQIKILKTIQTSTKLD
jgi:hypothetical protein